MDVGFLAIQVLTGLAYGMLLFLIAVGLSVIFGLMHIINLAHGTFFVLGTYITLTLIDTIGFWGSLVVAALAIAVLGVFIERGLLANIYGKELDQVLLTFGLAFIITDLVKLVWGTSPQSVPSPAILDATVTVAGFGFPVYRLFVLVVGLVLAPVLWYLETRTRIGAIVRAGVDDREMITAMGININAVFAGVFAFGAGLAAIGGVLGGPMLGTYPDLGFDILVTSLIVVVIGGLGTWKGAFAGAILVGLVETLGRVWFPQLSLAIVFVLMVIVLLARPSGLFGRSITA